MRDPGERHPRPGQGDFFAAPSSSLARPAVCSVSELTRQLKGLLEMRFAQVAVRGEISNLRPAASGHVYFTLKDQGACISAVMFQREASRLGFRLQDGQLVIAYGRVSVYEPRGQYQLILEALAPEGAGALALAFEQLKQRLGNEGLFDPARKRALPMIPRRIGVVTSPSGAAIRDFLRVLHERFPVPVLIAPARVQGAGAAEEIAAGVRRLGRSGLVDVILVTRGGGSLEDLWAFNEEVLARAIVASPVPVVSAVGHEVDFTISDFVADRRCATPTDAARTLAPVRQELRQALDMHRRHLGAIARRLLSHRRERLGNRAARLGDPRRLVAHERIALDHAADRLAELARTRGADRRAALRALELRLGREHPRSRLMRLSRVLAELHIASRQALGARLAAERERLPGLHRRLVACQPSALVGIERQRIQALRERAEKALVSRLGEMHLRLSRAAAGLQSLSPLEVLGRGYSITFTADGRLLKTAREAPPGTRLRLLLSDRSELEADVTGRLLRSD